MSAIVKPELNIDAKLATGKWPAWIYNPAIDLAIGCGAWSAPLLLITYIAGGGLQMTVTFYALTLLFNNPHYMATIYRAYGRREDFSKYKLFTLHFTALLLLTAAIAHRLEWLLPWLYTIYITWSPWHYAGQNFGLAMMFARRAEVEPRRDERNALYLAFLASYLMLFVSFHTGASSDPFLISLNLPAGGSHLANWLLLGIFICSAGYALLKMTARAGLKAMTATSVMLSTQMLWFVMPVFLQLIGAFQIPQARYSSGVLALMHSAQYLWITSYYAKREAEASNNRAWKPLVYFATLMVGGIALFVPAPWLVSYVFHYDFSTSFLIFVSLINIHHFILDGAIWKLRDSRIAARLLNTREKVAAQAKGVGSGLSRFAGWIAGKDMSARLVRVSIAVSLVLFAGLDQSRFYLGIDDRKLTNLTRAENLNPYDAAIYTRIARAQSREGNLEDRLVALRQAIALNPRNAATQNVLAQALVENKRYEEAFEHYKKMLNEVPTDSSAYFNFGMLAAQLNRNAEAIEAWKKAVAIDPQNALAQLKLAEIYDRNGAYISAIQHYEQYLVLISANGRQMDAEEVLYIALKLAEEYTLTSQNERASEYYEKIIAIAAKSDQRKYASLAYVRQADLYAEASRKREAAFCYQQALKLDASVSDAQAEGADWFNYGRFLRTSEAPARLSLACFIKAEQLLKSVQSSEVESVIKEMKEVEDSIKADSVGVRRDLKSVLDEALSYQAQ